MMCNKCGLPEIYDGILLDSNGVCNYCNFYSQIESKIKDYNYLKKEFERKIFKAKKIAKEKQIEYDCIIGFSGGKDSTYVAYQIKHKYNLNVLAVTYDNGFSNKFSQERISKMLKKLDIDSMIISPKNSLLKKVYSLAIEKEGISCGACTFFTNYYIYLVANQKEIPLIINGYSPNQRLRKAISKESLEPFNNNIGYRNDYYNKTNIKNFIKLFKKLANIIDVQNLSDCNIENLTYFMYHPYERDKIIDFLSENLNWEMGERDHSDCKIASIANCLFFKEKRYPFSTGEIAVDVRRGNLSVTQALEKIKQLKNKDKSLLNNLNNKDIKEVILNQLE